MRFTINIQDFVKEQVMQWPAPAGNALCKTSFLLHEIEIKKTNIPVRTSLSKYN